MRIKMYSHPDRRRRSLTVFEFLRIEYSALSGFSYPITAVGVIIITTTMILMTMMTMIRIV